MTSANFLGEEMEAPTLEELEEVEIYKKELREAFAEDMRKVGWIWNFEKGIWEKILAKSKIDVVKR